MTYEELVKLIGPGFHPDTSGANYTSLPEGLTAEEVDATVNLAVTRHHLMPSRFNDPYARAWAVFESEGWVNINNEGA